MIVFKLGFIVGLVLASPVILWQLWAFLAPALYEREKRALVPALFVGLVLFLTGAVTRLPVRGAPGAPGAVQLSERGDRAVHHLRRLVRLRAPGGARPRHLVRAAADHDHPVLAGGDRAGRAPPVPPLRGGLRLHRRRGALARRRPPVHADDDGAAPLPLRGRRGRVGHRAAGSARRRRSRPRSSSRSRSAGRRRAPRSRCPGGPRRTRSRAGLAATKSTSGTKATASARASRSTAPRPGGSASRRRRPAASRRPTRWSPSC